ncbi:hypothetical protein SAMN05444372_10824 [Flavobacterium micromati]|jgi:hypothetical protein|uniref:Magnesium citrate secondary transporter n=2 Tax=Flavobacterium micromati TaxID=229205 RepID=A0A1M5LCQ1_9FLAO|nr:hypothetical protein SAMN05444372_10824 [Flavobacterium micromati]
MFRKSIYIGMFGIALLIYIMQRLHFPLPAVINNYVNDLLCLPLLLAAMEFIIKRLKKDKYFKFPVGFVIFLASYYSIYFEYYLPTVNPRYTADWIDVILYFAGGLTFYFSEKHKKARICR